MIEKLGRNLQLNDVLLCNGVHYKVIDLWHAIEVNVIADGFVQAIFLKDPNKHPLIEMANGEVFLRCDKAIVMSEADAFELQLRSLQ